MAKQPDKYTPKAKRKKRRHHYRVGAYVTVGALVCQVETGLARSWKKAEAGVKVEGRVSQQKGRAFWLAFTDPRDGKLWMARLCDVTIEDRPDLNPKQHSYKQRRFERRSGESIPTLPGMDRLKQKKPTP